MSFEPVTMWTPRCDGETVSGQCLERYHWLDEDEELVQATLWQPHLDRGWVRSLTADGWMLIGPRLLCPQHVAAAAHLAAAALDGLPFQNTPPPAAVTPARSTTPHLPLLRVLVGAPGSGKTTWCTRNKPWLGTVLSLDHTRALVGTGEADQAATPAAVEHVRDRAACALMAHSPVTIDATGATPADRATWLALAGEHGALPVAVVFRVPLDAASGRNARRRRQVPGEVIARMWHHINATTARDLLAEGFHAVIELRGT